MTENLPSTELMPSGDIFGKQELDEIFRLLTDEAKRRLTKPAYIRQLDTDALLSHIEKIIALNKKTPIINPTQINLNLGAIQKRAVELATHPARRKQIREQFRINRIPRGSGPR